MYLRKAQCTTTHASLDRDNNDNERDTHIKQPPAIQSWVDPALSIVRRRQFAILVVVRLGDRRRAEDHLIGVGEAERGREGEGGESDQEECERGVEVHRGNE